MSCRVVPNASITIKSSVAASSLSAMAGVAADGFVHGQQRIRIPFTRYHSTAGAETAAAAGALLLLLHHSLMLYCYLTVGIQQTYKTLI